MTPYEILRDAYAQIILATRQFVEPLENANRYVIKGKYLDNTALFLDMLENQRIALAEIQQFWAEQIVQHSSNRQGQAIAVWTTKIEKAHFVALNQLSDNFQRFYQNCKQRTFRERNSAGRIDELYEIGKGAMVTRLISGNWRNSTLLGPIWGLANRASRQNVHRSQAIDLDIPLVERAMDDLNMQTSHWQRCMENLMDSLIVHVFQRTGDPQLFAMAMNQTRQGVESTLSTAINAFNQQNQGLSLATAEQVAWLDNSPWKQFWKNLLWGAVFSIGLIVLFLLLAMIVGTAR